MQEFIEITNNIKVSVIPIFLPDKSLHANNFYTWAYNVRIDNLSEHNVQLLTRYWRIVDESGFVQEVKGEGVIGEQPIIIKGKHFIYSSGTYLKTPSGVMSGSYQMINIADHSLLDVNIPMFSLDSPFSVSAII